MTRSGLAERVAKKGKMSVLQAELVVDSIFDCMTSAFLRGERVEVRGLGTFHVRSYKGYKGRNPKTGEAIIVQPKRLPVFKVGRVLSARVAQQPSSRIQKEGGTRTSEPPLDILTEPWSSPNRASSSSDRRGLRDESKDD
jgi:integration host factor subunit beta